MLKGEVTPGVTIAEQIIGTEAQLEAIVRQHGLISEELLNEELLLAKGLSQASAVRTLQREDALGLLPGMPVEVFFKTHDRTPIEYLVKPLTDYLNLAFREG